MNLAFLAAVSRLGSFPFSFVVIVGSDDSGGKEGGGWGGGLRSIIQDEAL